MRRIFPATPAITIFGILMALWFGACLIIEPFFPIAPGLFLKISTSTSIGFGVVIAAVSLAAILRPKAFGMTAVFTVCAIRTLLGIQTHNAFPVVLWVTLFLLCVWREKELQDHHRAESAREERDIKRFEMRMHEDIEGGIWAR